MTLDLLAHIVVPLLAVFIVLLWRATARTNPIDWEDCNEIAVELTILSIGASGAIFINPGIIAKFGERASIYGILIVLTNVLLAGINIARAKGRVPAPFSKANPVTAPEGLLDLFLGVFSLMLAIYVIIWGLWR